MIELSKLNVSGRVAYRFTGRFLPRPDRKISYKHCKITSDISGILEGLNTTDVEMKSIGNDLNCNVK